MDDLTNSFKTLVCGPVWGLNPRLSAQQPSALTTKLTGRWLYNMQYIPFYFAEVTSYDKKN